MKNQLYLIDKTWIVNKYNSDSENFKVAFKDIH